MKTFNSYSDALKNDRLRPGAKVIAYPDHNRTSQAGIIDSITAASIIVRYGDSLIELDRRNGKFVEYCDSSLDINLIEVDD